MFCFSMAVYHYGLFSNPTAAQGNWWLRVALGLLTSAAVGMGTGVDLIFTSQFAGD